MARQRARRQPAGGSVAPTVLFGSPGVGRKVAYAALSLIANKSSFGAVQAPLPDTGQMAGRVRSSSAQAEWLGDCAIARNAQLSSIII
jgi:hypothetical protein